jgi:hypothetical protein
MSGYPGFGRGGGSNEDDDGGWSIQGVRGGRGIRPGRVGYGNRGGRDGGRGRGSAINNGQKTNRYEQFSDTEFEDAEEEASDDDDEDDEDETAVNEDETKHTNSETGGNHTTVNGEEKKDEDAYDGDDFITEEEMQNKQNTADDKAGDETEMVGVVTQIQKKRALSIEDEPTKADLERAEEIKAAAAKADAERAAQVENSVILDYSKDPHNTANKPTTAETKAIIKERGDNMVETKTTFETTTKVEFNLQAGTTKFSIRHSTIQALKIMQKIDKTLTINSVADDTQWTDFDTLPSNSDDFSKHFNVREENPPNGAKKIVIHFKLHTSARFGDIKYDAGVFSYLKENRIYIKVDKFEMRKMASPGFLIDIHPHLTNLTDLQSTLSRKMENTKLKDQEIAAEWKEQNPNRIPHVSTAFEQTIQNCTNIIPHFQLHTGKRSFGTAESRVETVCLIVECASIDARYLKALLSSVYSNQEYSKGMFVPSGMHLMESPTVLCNLLRRHNKYLKTTSAVPIFGLKASALQTDVILDNGETHDLSDFIEQYIPEIESVERTNKTTNKDQNSVHLCRRRPPRYIHKICIRRRSPTRISMPKKTTSPK